MTAPHLSQQPPPKPPVRPRDWPPPSVPPSSRRTGRVRRRLPARRRPLVVDALAAATGLGLGISLALGIGAQTVSALHAPGGVATALGRVTGMLSGYAMVITVLLSARIPPLERALGQDRLIVWHRRIAPWGLYLLLAHAVLITVGYARAAKTGILAEIGQLLWTYSGILSATVGSALLLAAGVTSYRRARHRMKYETWWAVHLYTYLGLGLSFVHQVDTGAPFVGHSLATAWWTSLWVGALTVVLVFRVGLPLWRSVRHDLRVAKVSSAGPDTWSIVLSGRHLERLPTAGGQFMMWRFLRRELWWQAHPYSLSAAPDAGHLRITVKELGDHSTALSRLAPGTRVAFEGPYGVFTADARQSRNVLLVGAGVGTTPIRALLDDLPRDTHVVVLLRGRRSEDIAHLDEFERLVGKRRGRLHALTGPRETVRLDAPSLHTLVPDIAGRDVFVCGPGEFTRAVIAAARDAGVPARHIHHEDFAF
ncbi:ferric reductase-like transmembrane domain-containing protein [Streptomyces sp. NPDC060065]|uniref:ferredoxin reductase family protein n=1 Tax=Streptomyces sp. NPDC060065 TaxID=3347050 RepID=UPI0036AD6317